MANVSGMGTVWNLPNYDGELYTAAMIDTPFLSMIGGMNGGKQTSNFQFATDTEYEHEVLAQKSITETGSLTAPTSTEYVRTQNTNVTQIFQEAVNISYVKMSNYGRLSGVNTAGSTNPQEDEKNFQIAKTIEAVSRQVEWHMLQGTYAIATNAGEPNQMRGMLAVCAGKSTVDASAAAFSDTLFKQLLLEMFNNGAAFRNIVAFMNGYQRQVLSAEYAFAPESRTVGGYSIQQIQTDFGNIAIAPAHRMMPTDTILLVDVSACYPVFQPVPTKGNFFYEELAKVGASERGQLFGQISLSYGPDFYHGSLTNLATS